MIDKKAAGVLGIVMCAAGSVFADDPGAFVFAMFFILLLVG